jgi:hypothetical protein
MKTKPQLTQEDLDQFCGTEEWYRHGLNSSILFTEGAKYLADAGQAYWLLDIIALSQLSEKRVAEQPFQVWTLRVRADRSATITCEDGDDTTVYTQAIEFTDFPLDSVTLWFAHWAGPLSVPMSIKVVVCQFCKQEK